MQVDVLTPSAPAASKPPDGVRSHTPARVNHKIDEAMMKRVWKYSRRPREEISARIKELDREWDLERVLETNAAGLALGGLLMSLFSTRRWLLLPASVLAFLLQHSLTRRSAPVQMLRRLGVRTRREIEGEKNALRMLRGDFDSLNELSEETHRAIEALRLSRA